MMAHLLYAVRTLLWGLQNALRRLRKAPDYVVFTLEGAYPRLRPSRGPFWQRWISPPRPSLQDLAERFRTVAADPHIRGVVLHLRPLAMPAAHLQTLCDLVRELREAGKRVIAWSHTYEISNYYVACACDEVLLQPGGSLAPLGVKRSFLFLKDALDRVGIEADIVQISPYKTAGDPLMRSEMSREMREMMTWLLDSLHGQFLQAVAEGRGLDAAGGRALVDGSPYTDQEALEARAVDAIVSEEDLPTHLAVDGTSARLASWDEAHKGLVRRPPERPGRYIALLRIEGDIIDGRSGRPPVRPPVPIPFLLSVRSGDLTVVQQARRVLRDKCAAALVVYVDSGGGSAAASEAMAAALAKVAEKKPVVVAMGGVATSGGYYVATPGQYIVAQPGTITGSIGVLSGKIVSAGIFEKLLMNRELLARGRRAAMYDPGQPFSEEERGIVWKHIRRTYDVFLDRVSQSRQMSRDDVDRIGGGRVWTGRQALEHGLVDELGDLDVAIEKARRLAELDERAPVREVPVTEKRALAPEMPTSAALYSYALEGFRTLRGAQALLLCPFLVGDEFDPFG